MSFGHDIALGVGGQVITVILIVFFLGAVSGAGLFSLIWWAL